jgi:hypothetical protein
MTITDQAAIIESASRAYLAYLQAAPTEVRERQTGLAAVLDDLCVAYNKTRDVEPETMELDSPRADLKRIGERTAPSFPELGFYAEVDPLQGQDQQVGQGWALDDLMDIATDLAEVLWFLDQRRIDDAIWQFRWGYQNHWGDHLHGLRRFLHKSLYWG